ncbi:MAG TPA: sodium:proton antiporter [Polyangiaceae bacterium]|nr:sodium:proton antiporter [Polyangiaceae bacterium]
MPSADFPAWTLLPFPALVLGIAVLPLLSPRYWAKRRVQIAATAAAALPVVTYELVSAHAGELVEGARSYLAFIIVLGALFTASGGIHLKGDLEATPRTNLLFLLLGSVLANLIGTTGASMLLIRPLLRTNRQREQRAHLVPFFILLVANVGGLLTPLGGPLLVGYVQGVPFLWTLRLFPIWFVYVASLLAAFYVTDKRAHRRESSAALSHDGSEREPLVLLGRRNLAFLAAIVPAALLPAGFREATLIAIALGSYFGTPGSVHQANSFSFGPISEVAIVFAGLFLCLGPINVTLAAAAPRLPLQSAWQLFWGSGLLSSVLDNAPTYTAFAALARGLVNHSASLVAGIAPIKLAAISAGSVVMGATTYLGNGPNLMVKAVAEHERYAMPSFMRYFAFAFLTMLPAHLVITVALWWLER